LAQFANTGGIYLIKKFILVFQVKNVKYWAVEGEDDISEKKSLELRVGMVCGIPFKCLVSYRKK
jgi:hypothetical protein